MSRFFQIDPGDPARGEAALAAAAAAIGSGGLAVLPTETVYGLAARPDDTLATARVFASKRRPTGLNLPVLAAEAEQAFELASPLEAARRLAATFWPGPLTMVLPRTARSQGWSLGEHNDTIGVRVPAHAVTGTLLRLTGPLAVTSANLSGRPPLSSWEDLWDAFGEGVDVYLLAESSSGHGSGLPSTVVDLTGREPRLVRLGALSEADVASALSAGRHSR